jgi:hypothetical protein
MMGDRRTLRIGITGYHNLNPEQIGTIEQGIDKAICFIEEQYADHYITVFSSWQQVQTVWQQDIY